jgi:hypothetical protein
MTHLRLGLKLNAMHLFISGFERLDSSRKYSQLSTEFTCASCPKNKAWFIRLVLYMEAKRH